MEVGQLCDWLERDGIDDVLVNGKKGFIRTKGVCLHSIACYILLLVYCLQQSCYQTETHDMQGNITKVQRGCAQCTPDMFNGIVNQCSNSTCANTNCSADFSTCTTAPGNIFHQSDRCKQKHKTVTSN
jgi:hypothetical protein